MHLILANDYEGVSKKAARRIADAIIENPNATVCLTSGDTPNGTYRELVKIINEEKVSIENCFFVGLDEWVGMNHFDEGSCGFSVFREFITPLGIKPENRHFFDGRAADLKLECKQMDDIIASLGGFDVMLVGIGQNAHIGLNEPGYSWKLKAHVSDLAEITKTVGQKYFTSETTLTQGITLGLSYFSEAKLPILIANGEKKADVIHQIIMEEASEDRPASILQVTPHAVTIVDRAAAAKLG